MLIAHITDLHVARPPRSGELNAKRLLGYINYRLFRSRLYREEIARAAVAKLADSPPDLAVLTGDITQHGLDSEFDAARELLAPLSAKGVPVIAVPGNHDIYGDDELGAGLTRLGRFTTDILLDLRPDVQGIFRFPGVEILPLMQGVPTPVFCSYGKQTSGELRRAREVWTGPPDGVMRLALGHYPVIDSHGGRLLYVRGLRDAAKLIDFCRDHQVAGYFCGHNHKRYTAPMPGACVQYAAPALSSVRNSGNEWISVYRCGPDLKNPVDVQTEKT